MILAAAAGCALALCVLLRVSRGRGRRPREWAGLEAVAKARHRRPGAGDPEAGRRGAADRRLGGPLRDELQWPPVVSPLGTLHLHDTNVHCTGAREPSGARRSRAVPRRARHGQRLDDGDVRGARRKAGADLRRRQKHRRRHVHARETALTGLRGGWRRAPRTQTGRCRWRTSSVAARPAARSAESRPR